MKTQLALYCVIQFFFKILSPFVYKEKKQRKQQPELKCSVSFERFAKSNKSFTQSKFAWLVNPIFYIFAYQQAVAIKNSNKKVCGREHQ